jgi:heptosyltransferase II
MKILIELPTWLGDTVMATPAIENLIKNYSDVEITLIGSFVSIEALKNHPKVLKTYILEKNLASFFKILKSLDSFDLFFSFRGSSRSKLTKFFISSKSKYQYKRKYCKDIHQVEKYNSFVNKSLSINTKPSKLLVYKSKNCKPIQRKILGINPGASYGSAKRWYPEEFARVAMKLSNKFDIIILGGPGEKDIAKDIEDYLVESGIQNFQNLTDKTSINELTYLISGLDLLITGDSGPMHLAAAFNIPTVSIFGPTQDRETSQWMNNKNIIVKKNLDCQPCMKRKCPLGHHNCMKLVDSSEVLSAVKVLI